jgi:hypothetical protein
LDGRAAAVSRLTRISPAVAVDSMSTVRLAAGPVTMNSRCDSPTRKKWKVPLFTPTDIRRTTLPAVVSRRPTLRSVARIPWAAVAALAACPTPENQTRRASPPNFKRLPSSP